MKPIFVGQKMSDHGTSNPIVARLGPQVTELCDFFRLTKEQKEGIFGVLFANVGKRCLECFDIHSDFEAKILSIREEIAEKGLQYQSNGKVLSLPSMPSVRENAERFLYVAKSSLRDLQGIFKVFFGKDFGSGANYTEVIKWSQKTYGVDDPLTKQLNENYDHWIKELIAKRNAVEHPGGHSGHLRIKDYSTVIQDGTIKICEPIWYRNSDKPSHILNDMEIYVHTCFTFAEEIFVLCLLKIEPLVRGTMRIAEIPENQRRKEMPIRFRMVTI
ncbi:MAG: hypothetical protein ABR913_04085 [Sedimentisphaerales bacterium]|jgi:hypothetical protein